MKLLWKIMKESMNIVVIASIISSLGGLGLEAINKRIVLLIPIFIIIPAMNDMIGDFGAIISSRFTTMMYMGKLKERNWWKSHVLGSLFVTVAMIAVMSALYISSLGCIISLFKGFDLNAFFVFKLIAVSIITTIILVVFMFWISATAGFYVFKRRMDPANFLIPLTTSIGDFCSMLFLTISVTLFF